jgi:hypothetical protein
MRWVVAVALFALLAGCTSTVSGAPAGSRPPDTEPRITAGTTTGETPATGESGEPDLPAPPTSIDPPANQRYCERPITGAFGKEMMVVVVETPAGRVDCDQASAVLVDYYAERPDPDPGSDPIAVAGFACNQVPYPDVPQVICADGDSLLYSMWRQGG